MVVGAHRVRPMLDVYRGDPFERSLDPGAMTAPRAEPAQVRPGVVAKSAPRVLQRPAAGKTPSRLVEPQFSTQTLFFDAEWKRLMAIATNEISRLMAHGALPL